MISDQRLAASWYGSGEGYYVPLSAFRAQGMVVGHGAAKAGNDCRSKGIAVSVVDVAVCAVALAPRWSVFTLHLDSKRMEACSLSSSTRPEGEEG